MSNDMIRMGGIVAVALIVAITALTIFHPGDNTATITAMVAAALSLFSAVSSRANAAIIKESKIETTDKLHAMHVDINDRVDQLVTEAKSASRAEGVEAERERGREAGRETA